MPSNNLKVSIVIPNHNYEKWVAGAIYSVYNDPYPNKEIIVVDDGSTDNSWDVICKTLSINDNPSETLLKGSLGQTHAYAYRFMDSGGPSRTRNLGIKIGWESADLFAFLDSDDEYVTGKLEKSVIKFKQGPQIGAVYSDYTTFNEKTGIECRVYKQGFDREILINDCIVNNDSLVNKEALATCGLYDENMRVCEDYDLWCRISERYLITHIPESLVMIRVGSYNSTSTVPNETWIKCRNRVFEKINERQRIANGR